MRLKTNLQTLSATCLNMMSRKLQQLSFHQAYALI